MTSWQTLSPYLDEVLDLPPDARAAWLDSLRAKDPEIAAGVERLLAEHRAVEAERFLAEGVGPLPGGPAAAGQVVGAYTLVSPIGQGGMGTVWLARRSDGRYERSVAVKFLSVALAARGQERFRREGRILARLTHPHIASLVDAGVTSTGQPYLVLEFVDGPHIDRYCDEHALTIDARVRLFLEVLAAVAHAHANLIVHRDLKPSNVLVTQDGVVKLLDFGIAKLLEHEGPAGSATILTREGGAALTPEYAAPEQLTGDAVSTATDVYALGVLLYVLLTGQHPAGAHGGSAVALMNAIVDTEPMRPSHIVARTRSDADLLETNAAARATTPARLRRTLRGDLDTILQQALKKEPRSRYGSVTAFAADLDHYLKREPISAAPDTIRYRAAKFVRRNRIAVALGTLAVVAAVAGVIATMQQARTARVQRDFALSELSRAEAINDLNTYVLSDAAPSGKPFTVDDLLASAERIVERQGDTGSRVELLIAIGHQYTVQDEYAKARRLLEQAYLMSRASTDPTVRAGASCALAQSLANVNDLQRAESVWREAISSLPAEPRYVLDRIDCLQRGSEIAVRTGAATEAVARAQEAQRLLPQSPLRSELEDLGIQITLAGAYSAAGRHRDASAAFQRAAARLAALGRDNTARGATVFNNWGLTLTLLGQPLQAEQAFRRAIAISSDNASDHSVAPMLLVNYARVLQDLNRLDEATDYADRAYVRASQSGALVIVSQLSLLQAAIYRLTGQLDRSAQKLAEAEPWLRKNLPPGHYALGAFASQQSLLAAAQGDWTRAQDLADSAVSIVESAAKAGKQGADYVPVLLVRRSDVELARGAPATRRPTRNGPSSC